MGHDEGQHDESLLDKVKNALGMGHDRTDDREQDAVGTDTADDRADGWAGVPEALHDDPSAPADRDYVAGSDLGDEDAGGLGRNPGPIGSAQYEGGASPDDFGGSDVSREGDLDTSREDRVGTEFGGAYGEDDTPMPTSAAYDRGEREPMPPGEASFGTDEDLENRRERGI